MLTTPALLVRTTLSALAVQLLLVLILAPTVPHASAWLTTAGFVTPYYDRNVFAVKLVPIPWTEPQVFVSVQTLVQMLAIALAVAAVVTLIRTNPWHHGGLADAGPPPKESAPKDSARPAAPAGRGGDAAAGSAGPPAPPPAPRP